MTIYLNSGPAEIALTKGDCLCELTPGSYRIELVKGTNAVELSTAEANLSLETLSDGVNKVYIEAEPEQQAIELDTVDNVVQLDVSQNAVTLEKEEYTAEMSAGADIVELSVDAIVQPIQQIVYTTDRLTGRPLIGVQDDSNRTFTTYEKFVPESAELFHNGRRLTRSDTDNLLLGDYFCVESGGAGTGYNTIIFLRMSPAERSVIRINYVPVFF